MKRLLIATLVLALAASFLVMPTVSADSDDVLWGVTGVNWDYSEVFKVDVATGVVTLVRADEGDPLYSDIAVTPDGKVYTVGMSEYETVACPGGNPSANFDDLYRLDPSTGAVIDTWEDAFTEAGFRHVNALAAKDNTHLLAIEGGGVCPGWNCEDAPKLLQITLDGAGDVVSITSLGVVSVPGAPPPESTCCDGDLDQDPDTGKWYAGFWEAAGSGMVEVNLANPSNSLYASQSAIAWQGGFAYTPDGTAYAGSWADKNLYAVDVTGGGSTVAHDLGSDLSGTIWGLSRDKEEAAVGGTIIPGDKLGLMMPWLVAGAALLVLMGGSLLVWHRKRAQA